jgi:protein TonB
VADADEPPAGDQLGLDAEGVAGGDGFGLLGRKGGRDLLGAGSGDQYKWYGQILKNDLIDKLAEIRDIRRDRYSVVVRLWLAPDGRIQRFSVVNSTGDNRLDRDLALALESLDRVSEVPPAGLPQPVRLRIVSRI